VTKPPKKNGKDNGESEPLGELTLEGTMELMKSEDLDELEITEGGAHLKLVRESRRFLAPRGGMPVFHEASGTEAGSSKPAEEEGIPVKSPIAGIFYRAASPATPPFVNEGDAVVPGKTLCIIEAMKVMNEISSPAAGTVIKIKVENGKPVEANQVLFLLAPTK